MKGKDSNCKRVGYPSKNTYKLYIRKTRCLLELGKVREAQASFDKAIDAIDRSGLKKDMRKGREIDLQWSTDLQWSNHTFSNTGTITDLRTFSDQKAS